MTLAYCINYVWSEGYVGGVSLTLDYCVSGVGVRDMLVVLLWPWIIV